MLVNCHQWRLKSTANRGMLSSLERQFDLDSEVTLLLSLVVGNSNMHAGKKKEKEMKNLPLIKQ